VPTTEPNAPTNDPKIAAHAAISPEFIEEFQTTADQAVTLRRASTEIAARITWKRGNRFPRP
jgi:hypothetical protein